MIASRTLIHPGRILAGRFRLDSPIASGGMGEVWRGIDLDEPDRERRTVAIKILRPDLRCETVFLRRLAAEATHLAALDHPSIARFVAHGHSGNVDYLAMQFVPGVPLHTLSEAGLVSFPDAARIIGKVADALAHAHDRGVVHRDVKPANILVDAPTGGVWVTDFGISFGSGSSNLTEVGRVMGTAEYLAPERVKGAASSPATDLYALGVTAFEVVAGYRPYDGPNPLAIAMKHVSDPIPRLPARVPPTFARVITRLLAKDPAARPASAAALAAEFFALDTVAHPTPPEPPAPPAPAAL